MPSRPRRAEPAPSDRPRVAAARVPLFWSAGVGAAFGALYLALAPPVPAAKDASELTIALALGGAAHPTGYPLYVLVGHLFVTLAHRIGASWAYAANAWSAVGAAVAIGLHHALAARIVPPRAAAGRGARFVLALVATALVGLHPVWLLDAMMAEVYSWHLAWVCGACLLTLAALRTPAIRGPSDASVPPARALALQWGLLCGVGLAHHLSSLMILVPLSVVWVVALRRARSWHGSLVPTAAVAALVPLLAYGFIAWRAFHPAASQWGQLEPTWSSVLAHVSGRGYGDLLGHFAPNPVQQDLLRGLYPVLFPALAAFVVMAARAHAGTERLALVGLAAAAGLQTAYAFAYGVSDPSSYFHPNLAIAVLAVPLLGVPLTRRPAVAGVAAVLAITGLAALGSGWIRFAFAVRAGTVVAERLVRDRWRSLPEGPAIVLWRHDLVSVIRAWQVLDGERPEVYVEDPYWLTWTAPRRGFAKRFGFDPLEGLVPLTASKLARIPENLNRQTVVPVFLFDTGATLRPLAKPAAADSLAR